MKLKLAVFLVLLAALGGSAFGQNNARMLSTPNAQTGTSYTFSAADTTRVTTFNNAGAVAVTLPNGATFGFGAGTMLSVVNLGAGQVTITCSSCTINGAATLVLSQNSGADIYGGAGTPAVNYIALPSPTGANFAALGGNNAFTGNNTHSGTETFNNTLTTVGNADHKISLQNTDFEGSSVIPPPGWIIQGTATVSYETVSPAPSKIQSIKLVSTSTFNGLISAQRFSVRPGDSYYLSGMAKSDGTATVFLDISWLDKNGASISNMNATTTSTSWILLSNTGTVPANAVSASVQLLFGSTTGTVWFDQITVRNVTHLGPETFTGALTANGNGAAGNVALKNAAADSTVYVSTVGSDSNDGLSPGTAKLTIPAALTTLFSGGRVKGTVQVFGGAYNIGSTTLSVGSTSGGTRAVLMLMPGVVLTSSVNSTTVDVIQLSGGSSLLCPRGGSLQNTSVGAQIQTAAQANAIRTMVALDVQNGSAESITIDGCQFATATPSRAMVDASATFNNTRISNNVINGYSGSAPGILVSSGTGATGAIGAILIDNNWIIPGSATASGIVINGVDPNALGSASIFGVTLFHNMLEATVVAPTVPLMTITGNATNVVNGLRVQNNWFNVVGAAVANNYKTVDVVTCHECTFDSNFYEYPSVTATGIAEVYLEATVPNHVIDVDIRNPSLGAINPANVNAVVDASVSPTVTMPAFSHYKQLSTSLGNRGYQIGGLSVPNVTGTAVATIVSGTQVLGTTAITTLNCATTITLSANAAILATDRVIFTMQGPSPPSGYPGLTITTQVNAGNAFITVCNPTAGSVTPGALTVNWAVIR